MAMTGRISTSSSALSSPAAWGVADVEAWARSVKLSNDTIETLVRNEVDGPTLVTLSREELQTELQVQSLPARRYLWDLIQSLRTEQDASDYSAAIDIHTEEISLLQGTQDNPDEASGGHSKIDYGVIEELQNDAAKQRQIIQDHLFAYQMQRGLAPGQQIFEDMEVARQEQERLEQLSIQCDFDRQYALSLNQRGGRSRTPPRQTNNNDDDDDDDNSSVPSLFRLCIDTCVDNRLNVAEAFESGRIKPIVGIAPGDGVEETKESLDGDESTREDMAINSIDTLPFIEYCNVCYGEQVRGFELACNHPYCVSCMRNLLRTALRDTSLLPLQCCEIPIDMNCSRFLLEKNQADLLISRVDELTAINKMYCSRCSSFINLDLVDNSEQVDFRCGCGTMLCTVCKTGAHTGLSCQENQAITSGSNDLVLELSREMGWKQCPNCSHIIELVSGCNHMTCRSCKHEFCFICLRPWNERTGTCSSGQCEVWDEDRLLEAGEARVQAEEAVLGAPLAGDARLDRLHRAMGGLLQNERCEHNFVRSNGYHGTCERCGYDLYAYGMVCRGTCGSTVCYTCAHHRIPQRGWR